MRHTILTIKFFFVLLLLAILPAIATLGYSWLPEWWRWDRHLQPLGHALEVFAGKPQSRGALEDCMFSAWAEPALS